jgi:hypothetical protein
MPFVAKWDLEGRFPFNLTRTSDVPVLTMVLLIQTNHPNNGVVTNKKSHE